MLLKFKHFLNENEIYLMEEIASNDAKGKLHELLVAKHLHADKQLPTRYTNRETQKTPQETHDDIKNSISSEDYDAADKRAKEAAEKVGGHLKSQGIHPHHIKEVVWTSNKADHKSLTGTADANSDADIMVKHDAPNTGSSYHGISLKVGSGKPNLRNPGLATLDKLTGAKSSVTKGLLSAHKKKLNELGYSSSNSQAVNHAQYKKDKAGENKEKADAADSSKLDTLGHLAKHYAEGINNLHPDHVKHLLTTLIAPKTKHPHIRVHTQTPKTGEDKPTVQHLEQHQEDLQRELNNHQHGYQAHSSGQTLHIHANNPDGTKGKRIASISMKGVSGPIKGIAGATSSNI